jgi:hypothetical protein
VATRGRRDAPWTFAGDFVVPFEATAITIG